jgi:hypothetical protein
VPNEDWSTGPARLFGTAEDETALIKRVPSSRHWDVTIPFSQQTGNLPLGAVRRIGFLLSGWPRSLDQLTADDSTRCMISRHERPAPRHVQHPAGGPGVRAAELTCRALRTR